MSNSNSALSIFIPKEIKKGETRVAATPETVKRMVKEEIQVFIESGAGDSSYISDDDYRAAGAQIGTDVGNLYASADVILSVQPPQTHPTTGKHQLDMMKKNSCWISMMIPQFELDSVKKMIEKQITVFSMNLIPRISRAQKMDALTSQSNIAGYKAVIMGANTLGKIFPLMMTASGTIQPAKVIVIGAGIAGLQAIATAKRLGANVEVSDVRPAVKEQVESLGAKFIEVVDKDAEDAGGYAKEASQDFLKRQSEELRKRITHADIVITTALVPGKKAPVLVTEEMVKSMKRGSVIVDLAVDQGGNCELSEPGKVVVKHGVTIIGQLNVPATVPFHATEMYAKNILNFVLDIVKDKKLNIDLDDEIVAGSIVTHAGKVYHKPTAELLASKGVK